MVEDTENLSIQAHMEFVDNMRETHNTLQYAEPWISDPVCHKRCKEHLALLTDMLPKFESCTGQPDQKHVDSVLKAIFFKNTLLEGRTPMDKPDGGDEMMQRSMIFGSDSSSGGKQDPKPIQSLEPPSPSNAAELEKYIPMIKRVLYQRSTSDKTAGDVKMTDRYRTYLDSAIDDLGIIYCYKAIPTKVKQGEKLNAEIRRVRTANQLQEIYHVTRIIAPWLAEKSIWKQFNAHHESARKFGAQIERTKNPEESLYQEISSEFLWYSRMIGQDFKMFAEDDIFERIESEGENDEHDPGDLGEMGEPQTGDTPSETPQSEPVGSRARQRGTQGTGTNTGNTPPVRSENKDKQNENNAGMSKEPPPGGATSQTVGAKPSDGTPGASNKSQQSGTTPKPKGAKPKRPLKSSRRIESDSDDKQKDKDSSKTVKNTMSLRSDPNFTPSKDDLSASVSGVKRKRGHQDKEKGDKVNSVEVTGLSMRWIPQYFTNRTVRQVPAVKVDKYVGGRLHTSHGVQTDTWKPRVIKRPRRHRAGPTVFNLSDWKHTPMASVNFKKPAVTEDNARWIEPKEGEESEKYRFKPGTLALAEIKHFMGRSQSAAPKHYPIGGSAEFDFLIPHTVMQRVILELGMERMRDCRFESLAYKILHYAGKHYLTRIYQDALMLATHMKHTAITDKDMLLARRMCGDYGEYNLWGYQWPEPKDDPIRLEVDPGADKARWNYEHQDWKSDAWKQKDWNTIMKTRKKGGLKRLWSEQEKNKDSKS